MNKCLIYIKVTPFADVHFVVRSILCWKGGDKRLCCHAITALKSNGIYLICKLIEICSLVLMFVLVRIEYQIQTH